MTPKFKQQLHNAEEVTEIYFFKFPSELSQCAIAETQTTFIVKTEIQFSVLPSQTNTQLTSKLCLPPFHIPNTLPPVQNILQLTPPLPHNCSAYGTPCSCCCCSAFQLLSGSCLSSCCYSIQLGHRLLNGALQDRVQFSASAIGQESAL